MIELRFQGFGSHPMAERFIHAGSGVQAGSLLFQSQWWLEHQFLLWALECEDCNQTKAAKLLGINFGTFRAKLRKHGIKIQNGKVVSGG